MTENIAQLYAEIEQATVTNKDELEQYRLRYLSKKGAVTELFEGLKTAAADDRRALGQQLNGLKNLAQERFTAFQEQVEAQQQQAGSQPTVDLTLPVIPNLTGTQHPLSIVRQRIIQIFERIGFNVSDGPEIESDWYNFGALNFPDNHPAREMQDTFFVEKSGGAVADDMLLRTHTSNVQIRLMEQVRNSPGRIPAYPVHHAGAGVSE